MLVWCSDRYVSVVVCVCFHGLCIWYILGVCVCLCCWPLIERALAPTSKRNTIVGWRSLHHAANGTMPHCRLITLRRQSRLVISSSLFSSVLPWSAMVCHASREFVRWKKHFEATPKHRYLLCFHPSLPHSVQSGSLYALSLIFHFSFLPPLLWHLCPFSSVFVPPSSPGLPQSSLSPLLLPYHLLSSYLSVPSHLTFITSSFTLPYLSVPSIFNFLSPLLCIPLNLPSPLSSPSPLLLPLPRFLQNLAKLRSVVISPNTAFMSKLAPHIMQLQLNSYRYGITLNSLASDQSIALQDRTAYNCINLIVHK